jgi:ATP-dependent exoDNAse (exonuclease V) beta subunit
LIPINEYGEKAAELYFIKSQEELLDNINILYVALTRAEEQLYIISNRNFTSKGELTNNMSSYFIKFLKDKVLFDNRVAEYEFGNPDRISDVEMHTKDQHTIKVVKEHFDPRKVRIAQREALMWGSTQLHAIEFGNVTHEILAYIKTANDIHVAIMKAIENGLIVNSQKDAAEQTLKDVVYHPDLAVFFAEGNTIFNEQSIISNNARTVKPDRVAIRDGRAYLLDYKTGIHLDKYEKQLQGYEFSLRQMGLTVERKTIVYIGEIIEVVEI